MVDGTERDTVGSGRGGVYFVSHSVYHLGMTGPWPFACHGRGDSRVLKGGIVALQRGQQDDVRCSSIGRISKPEVGGGVGEKDGGLTIRWWVRECVGGAAGLYVVFKSCHPTRHRVPNINLRDPYPLNFIRRPL